MKSKLFLSEIIAKLDRTQVGSTQLVPNMES